MPKDQKPADNLIETGKPDDPAKKDNPDTRTDQQKPFQSPEEKARNDMDPALETTRKAGQGSS